MVDNKVRKRLFLGLALGALLLGALVLVGLWHLSSTGAFVALRKSLLVAVGGIGIIILVAGLAGVALLAFSLYRSKSLGALGPFAFRMVNFAYPLALGLAKILSLDKDLIRRSFVEVHNEATKFSVSGCNIVKTLILAPHCLQKSDCPHKITLDVNNCKRCGACPIDGLLDVADRFGSKLAVVTGGTLARDVVGGTRPDAVVAIACERDLVSGILDVEPLTVIGVFNERPCGPCVNTEVDLGIVEAALRNLLANPVSRVTETSFASKHD